MTSLPPHLKVARGSNVQLPAAPVSLPPELLREIFLLACAAPHDTLKVPGEALRSAIVRRSRYVITATCECWRQIALETPSLWACIAIEYVREDNKRVAIPSPSLLALELARSAEKPLRLRVWAECQERDCNEIIALLLPQLKRCETIVVFGELSPVVRLLRPLLDGEHFSSLRLISVGSFNNPKLPTWTLDPSSCPNLQRLVVRNRVVVLQAPHPALEDLLLVHNSFGITANVSARVLQSATHLRTLDCSFNHTYSRTPPISVLHFPNLETLILDVDWGDQWHSNILHSIGAPQLVRLRLGCCDPTFFPRQY